jgi:hypothetical protein
VDPLAGKWQIRALGSRPPGIDRSAMPLWLLGLVALFAVQVSPDWYTTPDSVRYLSIARHIAAGTGIADLDNAAPCFPPGYPLLVSPGFALSARPFLAIAAMHVGLAFVLAWATWAWTRRRLGAGAPWVTALVLVNASLWYHFRRPLSELAFLTAAMSAVELLHALRESVPRARRNGLRIAGAAALLAALPLIREVGVVFAIGFVVVSLLDARDGRLPRTTPLPLVATLAACGFVTTALFLAYDFWAAQSGATPAAIHLSSLLEPPVGQARWTAEAVLYRIGELARLLVPGGLHNRPLRAWLDPRMVIYAPIALLVLAGWWPLAKRRDVLAVTAPCYVAIYLVWGFEAGTRYMLPLLPLVAGSFWCALAFLGRARTPAFAALIAIHLAVSLYGWRAYDAPLARRCAASWPTVAALARSLPPGARVSTSPDVSECVWSMLAFVLDRGVASDPAPWPSAKSTEWRVEPAGGPTAIGADVVTEVGGYRVLRRS